MTTQPKLILINGSMGAGKSTLSKALEEKTGWYHLEIDSLKREFRRSPLGYQADLHLQTIYESALVLAKTNLQAGYTVIIDKTMSKTFLQRFIDMATEILIPNYMFILQIDETTASSRQMLRDGVERPVAKSLNQAEEILELFPQAIALDAHKPTAENVQMVISIINQEGED